MKENKLTQQELGEYRKLHVAPEIFLEIAKDVAEKYDGIVIDHNNQFVIFGHMDEKSFFMLIEQSDGPLWVIESARIPEVGKERKQIFWKYLKEVNSRLNSPG